MYSFFVSSDIEGTCGISHWDETELSKPESQYFRHQMSLECAAACEGAFASGATDVLVKDAHDSARNIDPSLLPERVRIYRGWGREIHSMVGGLDAGFTGAMFTGYHSSSNTDTNPLSHTMNTKNTSILINGIQASEFLINAYACAMYDVPVIFISGDLGVCEQARSILPNIHTVPVSQGRGNGSISIHPSAAIARIREESEAAVRECLKNPEKFSLILPHSFDVEVQYVHHYDARRASFYPGAKQRGARKIIFSSDSYHEVLCFFMFCL